MLNIEVKKKESNKKRSDTSDDVLIPRKRFNRLVHYVHSIECELFLEYLEISLKECLKKAMLTSTLKAKVAVEVAFAMLHLHTLGMMHRDLKIESIMMNSVSEAKVIDFDLVHVNEQFASSFNDTLAKGVGTLAYMSPEMQNEDEYDNKTDVYSYGVVLYVLFTGSSEAEDERQAEQESSFFPIAFICNY